jgi:hypothetical protein
VRGLYTTKDTFVSIAMTCSASPAWLEQQTGVAWATLRKHYGKYMRWQGASEMDKLRAVASVNPPMQPWAAVATEIGSETPKIGSEVSKVALGQ